MTVLLNEGLYCTVKTDKGFRPNALARFLFSKGGAVESA